MDPQLGIVIAALIGGSGLLTLALKRTWSGEDKADAAFIKGHTEAKNTHREDLKELRAEFKEAMAEQDRRHAEQIGVLEQHVGRLHRAISKLVVLVAPEHMAEATAVLVELGLPGIGEPPGPTQPPAV